jgi:polysaccharide export outer membrane protein
MPLKFENFRNIAKLVRATARLTGYPRTRDPFCFLVQRRQSRGRRASFLLGIALLSGCQSARDAMPPTGAPVVEEKSVIAPTGVVSQQVETLSPADLAQVMGTVGDNTYEIGPNDIVSVYVLMHPELSIPTPGSGASQSGALITGDGYINIPLVGPLKIAGMTATDAQNMITEALRHFIRNPQVTVQIVGPQSLRYYLLGSFTDPGVKYPARQLSLLDALTLGGSVDLPHADLYQSYVAQNGVKLPVDLEALLSEGDMSQNIMLAPGDTIVIPSSDNEDAFVFGTIDKPGAIPFEAGRLSLLQALGAAGFNLSNYTDARLSRVRVIRPRGRDATFYVVDASAMLRGDAAPFALQPGDIVFIPPNAVGTWNQALAELLPSLQTAGAVLNPFVSIKYLNTH